VPDIDLVIPSALVEPGLATSLLAAVDARSDLPNWSNATIRADASQTIRWPAAAATTPAQSWVLGRRADVEPERINIAEAWASTFERRTPRGPGPGAGTGRYLLQPAHFTIARDHLRLDDPAALGVTIAEAEALAATTAPVLAEAGWRFEDGRPFCETYWFVERTGGSMPVAPSIEHAIGGNVADWQPRGAEAGDDRTALEWRRAVNEIQMLLHAHPVNEAREARGLPTINTVWLSGNGRPASAAPRYALVSSTDPLFGSHPLLGPASTRMLETFDGFVAPARAEDWTAWREQLGPLDARIRELVAAQRSGAVQDVTVVLCGVMQSTVLTFASADRRRIWRAWKKPPPLQRLFAEEEPS
jgi:hypothetical protein